MSINNDKLRYSLFVTASEVRISFILNTNTSDGAVTTRRDKNHLGFLIDFIFSSISIFFFCSIFSHTRHRDLTEIMSTELKMILFVMLEHFLLLMAWLIHKAIPDRPSSVSISLARADYESKLALKREVLNQLF